MITNAIRPSASKFCLQFFQAIPKLEKAMANPFTASKAPSRARSVSHRDTTAQNATTKRQAIRIILAIALMCLPAPLLAAIQLNTVVSSGLTSPLFVGNAGDGTNRLFIEEQS